MLVNQDLYFSNKPNELQFYGLCFVGLGWAEEDEHWVATLVELGGGPGPLPRLGEIGGRSQVLWRADDDIFQPFHCSSKSTDCSTARRGKEKETIM